MLDITSREVWTDWCRQRVAVIMLIMAAAFLVLLMRLIYLQVIHGERLNRMSENQAIRLQTLDPTRGLILDARGRILADNRPRFDILVTPRDAKPREAVAALLGGFLSMPPQEIMERMEEVKSFKPALIREDVGRDLLAIIEAHRYELPGVMIRVKPQRHFPAGRSTAHVVGYLSEISLNELRSGDYPDRKPGDFIGKYGVERECERHLAGRHGGRQVEADARGRTVRIMKTVPPEPGANVVLTLDLELQEKAESLLAGRPGAVVAMDCRNGRILVMASCPSFDTNWFVDGMTQEQWDGLVNGPGTPLQNKAIQATYAPGSTYKMITAMAALEEGVITPETEHFCPGHFMFGGSEHRCWKKWGHGKIQLVEAIAQSCDVYFYKVGLEVGVDNLAKYAKGCGLGRPTGVGLGREASGLAPSKAWKRRVKGKPWYPGETLSVAIGQGANTVTPLQLARYIAAVANGGVLHRPMVIDRVENTQGEVLKKFEPEMEGRIPASQATLAVIREGMWSVVNGPKGTARGICPESLEISGKTGTAQVVGRKGREKFLNETSDETIFQDHAWFVAFAPREKPEIAVAVLIEHGGHGTSAAPVARDVIQAYFQARDSGAGAEDPVSSAGGVNPQPTLESSH